MIFDFAFSFSNKFLDFIADSPFLVFAVSIFFVLFIVQFIHKLFNF